ncbi:hypothetical protein BDV96DRAFT_101737 [Lophiotrema nucula]|uniref:F-box domain-containing protein n=1 Tax=Lophiotrema nucula TaxID=690887 RepID=A0A6A5Z748_9PLEO|nr:hypothetical protein BDV96DRAFT_101737 [Lophiotrema nucula]
MPCLLRYPKRYPVASATAASRSPIAAGPSVRMATSDEIVDATAEQALNLLNGDVMMNPNEPLPAVVDTRSSVNIEGFAFERAPSWSPSLDERRENPAKNLALVAKRASLAGQRGRPPIRSSTGYERNALVRAIAEQRRRKKNEVRVWAQSVAVAMGAKVHPQPVRTVTALHFIGPDIGHIPYDTSMYTPGIQTIKYGPHMLISDDTFQSIECASQEFRHGVRKICAEGLHQTNWNMQNTFTLAGLTQLVRTCPNLQALHLGGRPNLGHPSQGSQHAGLQHLPRILLSSPNIQSLILGATRKNRGCVNIHKVLDVLYVFPNVAPRLQHLEFRNMLVVSSGDIDAKPILRNWKSFLMALTDRRPGLKVVVQHCWSKFTFILGSYRVERGQY